MREKVAAESLFLSESDEHKSRSQTPVTSRSDLTDETTHCNFPRSFCCFVTTFEVGVINCSLRDCRLQATKETRKFRREIFSKSRTPPANRSESRWNCCALVAFASEFCAFALPTSNVACVCYRRFSINAPRYILDYAQIWIPNGFSVDEAYASVLPCMHYVAWLEDATGHNRLIGEGIDCFSFSRDESRDIDRFKRGSPRNHARIEGERGEREREKYSIWPMLWKALRENNPISRRQ